MSFHVYETVNNTFRYMDFVTINQDTTLKSKIDIKQQTALKGGGGGKCIFLKLSYIC